MGQKINPAPTVNGYIHEVVKGMLQGDGLPVFLDEDLVSERMQAWGAKV